MNAAAYARSSRDRADASIAAQLHELQKLAAQKGLSITVTYEDAVQRGSTEARPAFQRLIADIKRSDRGWSHLLVYDTSRLARGRYIAQAFRHQCRKFGVEILCVKLPETDPISAIILESVFEAMDEVHSIMSRDKALAGMAENVRRGFRAGGRAPWGYRLEYEATGAVRDGKPVMKSRLARSADADVVKEYLEARARGVPRVHAASTVNRSATTLVDLEWNALVYAGHTVWNRHTDKKHRGSGQSKRRPRDEWQIQRNTHPALITEAQAERLLAQLQTSDVGAAIARAKRARSAFLLAELLEAPDGRRWEGSGQHYRLKPFAGRRGRWISADLIDRAVLAQLRTDLQSGPFIEELVVAMRKVDPIPDGTAQVRKQIAALERQKAKAARLALGPGGDAFVDLIPDLSSKIEALECELEALENEEKATVQVQQLTAAEIRQVLLAFDDERALVTALERVVLDPDTLAGQITYRLSVASPERYGRSPASAAAVTREFRLQAA